MLASCDWWILIRLVPLFPKSFFFFDFGVPCSLNCQKHSFCSRVPSQFYFPFAPLFPIFFLPWSLVLLNPWGVSFSSSLPVCNLATLHFDASAFVRASCSFLLNLVFYTSLRVLLLMPPLRTSRSPWAPGRSYSSHLSTWKFRRQKQLRSGFLDARHCLMGARALSLSDDSGSILFSVYQSCQELLVSCWCWVFYFCFCNSFGGKFLTHSSF